MTANPSNAFADPWLWFSLEHRAALEVIAAHGPLPGRPAAGNRAPVFLPVQRSKRNRVWISRIHASSNSRPVTRPTRVRADVMQAASGGL